MFKNSLAPRGERDGEEEETTVPVISKERCLVL